MSKKKVEDDGPKVPGYIVTFSDMVTLLLTFFVLLLSMANTQDDAKFHKGQASIKRAIATMGLAGFLPSKREDTPTKYAPIKYSVDMEEDQKENVETKDQYQTLRDTIFRLESLVTVSPSQIVGTEPIFETIGLKFNTGTAELSPQMHQKLKNFSIDLAASLSESRTIIYIVGFCKDYNNLNKNLAISSLRAKLVTDSLKKTIHQNPYLDIYYWGAGSGGDWVTGRAALDSNSDITIAIITAQ